jgi:hypothetical protein
VRTKLEIGLLDRRDEIQELVNQIRS